MLSHYAHFQTIESILKLDKIEQYKADLKVFPDY